MYIKPQAVNIQKVTHVRFHRDLGVAELIGGVTIILLVLLYPLQPDDRVYSRRP